MSGSVRTATRRASSRARRWWTAVAATTVPALVATLAVLHPGAPVSQVDLHDGSVWLTSTTALKLGRYNPQVDELNAGLITGGDDFDVLQDAGDVLLTEPGRISTVDPASVTLTARTVVPGGALVSMSSGTVGVVDPSTGDVWARTLPTIGTLAVDTQAADLELGPGGLAVTARDGSVLAAEADGTLHRMQVTDDGVVVRDDGALAGEPSGRLAAATAVGTTLVVLAGSTLHTRSRSVDLSGYGPVLALQQPGPRAATVLVATATALLEVPLDAGKVVEHETGGSGTPAAPVRVGACAHGAWASATGSYLQRCDGAQAEVSDLEEVSGGDRLTFRVNRDVVVLNDPRGGRLWVPMEDPDLREPNWQDVEPQDEAEDTPEESESRQSTQNLQAECSSESAAPAAADDEYGVRPGSTSILSVIDNDASSECGVLAISEHDQLPPEFGTLTPVHGGRAFQLTTTPGATGTAEFTYTITDGRGTSAPSTATVVLTVRDPAENGPPSQLRVGSMVVEQGGSATYDVLPDFRDPDGDHLILAGAAVESGGTVRTRQDGHLTFQSDGASLGRRTVRVLVSDGTETTAGSLLVDVRPVGSLPPAIDPVHAVTYVDEPVLVRPLDSVRSLSREPVRLAGVDEVPGARLAADLTAGTFTFTAPTPGTYYVTFLVTAPPQQGSGVARIDVRERPAQTPPPTAVLDVALLPPGGEVTIDPLANDVDPGGGVLVIQSVDAPAESGLRLAVLGHRLVRVTSTRVLAGPVTARYTISNGAASATGEILVLPIPASVGQQPPVVPNVTATVRTDGVVTVPVLDGAYDPDGDVLSLVTELPEALPPGQGLLFVSGDVLRYRAPATPMVVHATFDVRDPAGNMTSATLTVEVHTSDPETKPAPRPQPLTARVFQGQTVRIPVPLTGIDRDGDGVFLLGQDQAPSKGRITAVGPDWMLYEALPGELGTDTFTYAVQDWVGRRAVAPVRVGIAARPTTSAEVVSRDDDVVVRPGQSVEVRVLANDVDTGGGDLALHPVLEHGEGIDARVEGRRIVVRTPERPGVLQIAYTATNERGGQDTAVLTVTVTADAPILPPVAQDVVVPATETINRTRVEVDVLSLAENPSGPLSDLAVSVHPSAAEVAEVTSRDTVVVTLADRAQTLPYLLTNTTPEAQGLHSYAFITVPALGDFPPMRRPGAPDLLVIAGEPLRISLAEHVLVGPGRTARISDPAKVSATKADGGPLVVDDRTLRYTAQRSYAGPASISFEVTDGAPGDSTVRTRVMTLPVTVLAAEDHPPTFTPSVLDVAPGESTRVDLTKFTSAPVGVDGGAERYTYRLTSAPAPGFDVALSGTTLTVTASTTVPKGTVGGVAVDIGYGVGGRVAAQVDFRVVASSRPLARVVDHAVPDGVEGGSSTIQVLAGAFNPFPQSPLTVVDAVVETPGGGTAVFSGSQVTVRPAAGFIGQMVTRYRVRDVTGDPDRAVEGRIRVTVRGRPAAPAAPRAVEVRDRTVVLTWDAPANNGEPITGYRLTAQPGGTTTDCAGTTCTVADLTNDVDYTFSVVARNAVGWSEPSPLSPPARPDAKPLAPASPRVTRGDARIDVVWSAPQNPGSPIREYELEISPAGAGGGTARTTATSHTFTGLTNGTSYTVRVRALNSAPEPGDWSARSAAARPAREPDAPASVSMSTGVQGVRTVTVFWEAPASDGGEPVSEYRVVVRGGGTERVFTPGADQRNLTFEAELGRRYTVGVQARNMIGLSPTATSEGEVFGAPGGVLRLAADDVAESGTPFTRGKVVVRWDQPESSGVDGEPVTRYRVLVDGRAHAEVDHRTGQGSYQLEVGDLAAVSHRFAVVAVNSRGIDGPASEVSATPTTVAQAAQSLAASTPPGEVTFTWAPGGDGATPITGYRFRVEREAERDDLVGELPGGQRSLTVPFSATGRSTQQVTLTLWVVNARGESERAQLTAVAVPVPPDAGPDPGPIP